MPLKLSTRMSVIIPTFCYASLYFIHKQKHKYVCDHGFWVKFVVHLCVKTAYPLPTHECVIQLYFIIGLIP